MKLLNQANLRQARMEIIFQIPHKGSNILLVLKTVSPCACGKR
jgi:hypothetical protein